MTRKTKIVATIGPSTLSKEVLKKMIFSGVNVCRLNFSHINHESAKQAISMIKEINRELHVHTAILADLQGPKIRIGEVKKHKTKKRSGDCVLHKKRKNTIFINYSKFAKDVKTNDKVLVDDGKIVLTVTETNKKDAVKLRVVFGGMLYSNKGVNLPNTKITLPCLTKKDKEDLKFILNEQIEWIALSFIRSSLDIKALRRIIKNKRAHHKIVAKIEKPEAIRNIDNIIKETDAVMVARGDLGVEVPSQKVPVYQKMIVEKCIQNAKPVVIATQMLESMTNSPTATRAEVNDVANSVIDGADALMLSGETSVGKHPLKAVDTMRKIIKNVEKSVHSISKNRSPVLLKNNKRLMSNVICSKTHVLLPKRSRQKQYLLSHTQVFNTIKTSSFRPVAFIYAFTNNHTILNTLSLVWGVQGFYYDRGVTTDQTIEETKEILKKRRLLKKGGMLL